MSLRLKEILSRRGGEYILPFLWLHGEDEDTLRLEINKIYECGISSFCVESRPHPDFAGEKWWRDMDIILDEAKKLGMRIWILDDSHFPTGSAAGHAANCAPKDRKTVLGMRHIDVVGPLFGCSFMPPHEVEDTVYVIAFNRESGNSVDITDKMTAGRLYFDIPDGLWRIYYFYRTENCIHYPHVNHLRESGAKVLLDAVYEPHFAHYSADFGKTIAGFFSDEPGFYACEKPSYDIGIGSPYALLPWDDTLPELLFAKTNLPICEILPRLLDPALKNEKKTPFIRWCYMDIVSALYDKCFCSTIGDWCRAHGVEYMGHITEDENSHTKTGLSTGHFFRGMNGQDISGSDVVLHQILPGMEDVKHSGICGFSANEQLDGEFYSYALYQMTVSLSQLNPRMRGRAMCELFGAFGWGEGTKMMKWMADFLLVRGINTFVPHAFSPNTFPDDDCPPHFFANDKNPQYRGFQALMPYMNRVAHLLSGGHHNAQIAILYHGDLAWTGKTAMPSQVPGKVLFKSHLQYDIVSADHLYNAELFSGSIKINTQCYTVLCVPYAEYMPKQLIHRLREISVSGTQVIFIDALPKYLMDTEHHTCTEFCDEEPNFSILPLKKLSEFCRGEISETVIFNNSENLDLLQVYEYKHGDDTVIMLSNLHPAKSVSFDADFTESGNIYEYDAYENKLYRAKKQFRLTLNAYQSRLYVMTSENLPAQAMPEYTRKKELCNLMWTVSCCKEEEYPNFTQFEVTQTLQNYNKPDKLPNFSGIIRYEAEFDFDFDVPDICMLSISGVSETAELWLNGEHLGIKIAPHCNFDISKKLQRRNKIRIEVRNTLANAVCDNFSRYLPIEATGICGNISIEY